MTGRQPPQAGFTAIELMVAMALGSLVMIIAYSAFRVAAQTVNAANRLSVQNKLMRSGFIVALEDMDFWTLMDQPDGSPGTPEQSLRRHGTASFGRTGPTTAYGLPFMPLKDLPPPNEFAPGGRGFTLNPLEPELRTTTQFRDDVTMASEVFRLDQERGITSRPYQADDPRRWFRGYVLEAPGSDRRFGRYGLLTNKTRYPELGFGNDPRSLGQMSPFTPLVNNAPGVQIVTGPYGPYGGWAGDLEPRVHTWYENQTLTLFETLGTFAMADYLPANHVLRMHGTAGWFDPAMGLPEPYASAVSDGTVQSPMPPPHDDYIRIDERPDHRIDGVINRNEPWITSHNRFGGNSSSSAFVTASVTWNTLYAFRVGVTGTGSATALATLLGAHHTSFAGPENHWYVYEPGLRDNTWKVGLTPHRPADWPDLRMEMMRGILRGRHFTMARLRWTDLRSNEEAELALTSLSTTLRGARQQRHRDGGWAAWYQPGDTRNDPTLDAP